MSAGVEFSEPQLARLRDQLGLDPDATEPVVEAALVLALDLAPELVREVDRVLADEFAYLQFAAPFGWLDP
jgi:hypothetical protein